MGKQVKNKVILASMLLATSAFAGTYSDTTANNSFAAAANLNPYFSSGYNADVGDNTGANTSLAAPWVTVSGVGNVPSDFYSFTTNATGRVIIDIDYTLGYAGNPNGFDAYLRVYNSSFVLLASNDDANTTNGAGGSFHRYDSFLQFNSLAAGNYYVRVDQCCTSNLTNGSNYTMQVQAQVAAVPEPETYAMLFAGLALVGQIVRRKKAATAAV